VRALVHRIREFRNRNDLTRLLLDFVVVTFVDVRLAAEVAKYLYLRYVAHLKVRVQSTLVMERLVCVRVLDDLGEEVWAK